MVNGICYHVVNVRVPSHLPYKDFVLANQAKKYVLRAEDLPRTNKLPCAQRPIKRAKFEKYTGQARRFLQKGTITYGEAL